MQDRRANSFIDIEKQEEYLNLRKDEKNSAVGNICLEDAPRNEETKSEVQSVQEKKDEEQKEMSDDENSDSGNDLPRRRRGSDQFHDYEKLMVLPCSSIYEKSQKMAPDSYLVLMKILEMVFQAKNISEADLKLLSDSEIHLLSAFFSKKCKVNFSKSDNMSKVAEMINCHKSSYKHKRNEENYKLVFKKAIKHLTRSLKKDHPEIKSDKKKLMLAFYKRYFKEDFVKKGLDKEYDLPRNDQEKLANNFASLIYNPKTVNPKYISMVANSRSFIDDVVGFLNDHFMKNYLKSRYFKVERILDNCRELMKTVTLTGSSKELRDKIERNPRFKLPWYDEELSKAIKCVKIYLTTKCNIPASRFTI